MVDVSVLVEHFELSNWFFRLLTTPSLPWNLVLILQLCFEQTKHFKMCYTSYEDSFDDSTLTYHSALGKKKIKKIKNW